MTWLSTLMAMVGRFFITYAMNTGTQITFEVVPTELRGQGPDSVDFDHVFHHFGAFCSYKLTHHVIKVVLICF